jgi:signal transduction histidine kinase
MSGETLRLPMMQGHGLFMKHRCRYVRSLMATGAWQARAELGSAERWLRALGLAIWAFIGLSQLIPQTRSAGSPPAWFTPWLLYGLCFVAAGFHRSVPRWVQVGLLVAQSACVVVMPGAGFRGFEGLLMSLVSAQVPIVLTLRSAFLWMVVQEVPLLAITWPYQPAIHLAEIFGAYSTFSLFTLVLYWLHLQEVLARAEVARANAELIAARAMVVEGVRQGERLRISRDLHDSLGHHLSALALQLELAKQLSAGSVVPPLDRAQSLSKEALAEVRHVVAAMQSASGEDLGAELRAMAAVIPAPRIHVNAPDDLQIDELETRHALFRCVQEAITNSLKHAAAKNIWVDIARGGDALDVLVRDDGRGVREVAAGRGLGGIRSRVGALGGKAEFSGRPGEGFRVHLTIPIDGGVR